MRNKTKYIKLFEEWQALNNNNDNIEDKEYQTTIGELLNWATDSDWQDDKDSIIDLLMIDDEWPTDEELVGYHQMLKNNRDSKIHVYSQQIDGQILSEWVLDKIVFSVISWDWPFSKNDDLTKEEIDTYLRLERELSSDLEKLGANRADIILYVRDMNNNGVQSDEISSIGFKNWLSLYRSGSN